MNFREIRDEINAQLDYNPEIVNYRDEVARVVNRHYLDVSSQHPWLFLQKDASFPVYAKVEGATGVTITIDAANLRRVTGSGTNFDSHYEGQTFIGPDGVEHTISRVGSATSMFLSTSYSGAVAGSTSWSVNFRSYLLPSDCVDPISMVDRTSGREVKLAYISRAREEGVVLSTTPTGDPTVMVEQDWEALRSPDEAPTASLQSGGTLDADTEYEYCYTLGFKGLESPPSTTVSATPTGSTLTVRIGNLENTQWDSDGNGTLDQEQGFVRYIYRRRKTDGGRWVRITTLTAGSTLTYDDTGEITTTMTSWQDAEELLENGPRGRWRAYFTAGTDRTMRLRYQSRPRRLSKDSDYPAWPVQYHDLLVWKALEDLCLKHGMDRQASIYASRASSKMNRMKMKGLSRANAKRLVFRSFDSRPRRSTNWGEPSKT